MATIVTRAGKGSPLTNNEVDQNFINLNTDKLEGTVAIASGGTGQTTKTAAFDALSPATTKGDLIAFDGTDNVRLGVGTNDFVLTADSTTATGLAWKAAAGGSSALTISNKTSAYTVVIGDLGTIINCTSGTFTVSLTAAATLGAGFNCWIWNLGTGAITIDPDASETIDGVTTLILRAGEGTQVICNGTNWETGDKKTMRGFAEFSNSGTNRATASGASSMALGSSRATGTSSFAAALGTTSTSYNAAGTGAVAIGQLSNTNGNNAVALGYGTSATNSAAVAIGAGANATAANGISIGGTQAFGAFSTAIGFRSKAAQIGKYAYTGYLFLNYGDAQMGGLVLLGATTDATPRILTSNNTTAGAENQHIIENNSGHHFRISVVGRQNGTQGTAIASYEFTGLIRRASGVATTELLTSTKTVVFESVPGWDCNISADTTNGALAVTVTGAASTNIRWVARIDSTEVNGFLE